MAPQVTKLVPAGHGRSGQVRPGHRDSLGDLAALAHPGQVADEDDLVLVGVGELVGLHEHASLTELGTVPQTDVAVHGGDPHQGIRPG